MTNQQRMSPFSALFMGICLVGTVAIVSGASILVYGLRIVERRSSDLIGLAGKTISGLPDLLNSLPAPIAEILNDRRAPEYTKNIEVEVDLISDKDAKEVRPVLTIRNRGEEVVSLLAVRVAALDAKGRPRLEWTEVVATPIALEDEWRGPLMPGAERHVILGWGGRGLRSGSEELKGATEISEIRVWQPKAATTAAKESGT